MFHFIKNILKKNLFLNKNNYQRWRQIKVLYDIDQESWKKIICLHFLNLNVFLHFVPFKTKIHYFTYIQNFKYPKTEKLC